MLTWLAFFRLFLGIKLRSVGLYNKHFITELSPNPYKVSFSSLISFDHNELLGTLQVSKEDIKKTKK